MLERYFIRPETIDRIRASWLGDPIERYVIWLTERDYAPRNIWRRVPFGPCMAETLHQYIECREQKNGKFEPNDLFFSFRKCPISRHTISRTFRSILPLIGVDVQEGVVSPCPHSLRHSFAVGTLLRWYRERKNPAQYLLHLSTFLGHVNPDSTSVYLTITGDMLTEASKRFAQFSARLTKEVEL